VDATLRQMTAYIAVARAKSFTMAARDLHQSQSSLSRAVADLERQFGVQLLERDTRNVQLTAAGVEALRVAEHIVDTHHRGMRELSRYLAGESGVVVIATLPSVAARLLPPIISAFRDRWPGVSVRILDGLEGAVLEHVTSAVADFAVTTVTGRHLRLEHEPLVKDRFHAVLPPGHRLTAQSEISWAELAGEPFLAVGRNSSVRRLTDAAFLEAGLDVSPAAEASSVATVGGLIAAGLGVTAMPALVLPLIGPGLACRPLVGPVLERRLGIVHQLRRPAPVATGRFVDLLRERQVALPAGVAWA